MKKRSIIIGMFALGIAILLVFGFQDNPSPLSPSLMVSPEKVNFVTADGVIIIGKYYPVKNPRKAVLFLHMMPATKESWDKLARTLEKEEIASFAIDFRGHGESIKIQSATSKTHMLNYKEFTDEEHQQTRLDVEASLDWLIKEKHFSLDNIFLVGASIGANLTLQALADHPEISKGIMLSPGLNYRGILTKPLAGKLKGTQRVLYVTSKDDENNVQMTEELFNATLAQKQWKVYDKAGHGTNMLENSDDLGPSIVDFLQQ